jgi:hypothetical protein
LEKWIAWLESIWLCVCNHWRSLGKWVAKVKLTVWMHKQPYRRSLSVRGFSLHLQTISLAVLARSRGPPRKQIAAGDRSRSPAGEVSWFSIQTTQGKRCRVWRPASSSLVEIVSKILQRGAHAPVIAEGRAYPPCRPDRRSDVGRANFGRTAPPIYPSVSFRQGQRGTRRRSPWFCSECSSR